MQPLLLLLVLLLASFSSVSPFSFAATGACRSFLPYSIRSAGGRFTSPTRTRMMSSTKDNNNNNNNNNKLADDSKKNQNDDLKRIVLIGGGHAHLQLIKAYHFKARPSKWHVTLIDKVTSASYSGMIPGCISNLYTSRQTQIPLDELAEWAKVYFYHDTVVGIDFESQMVKLKNHDQCLHYDVVSIDIGSTSRGINNVPGVAQYAIPTRPIDLLVKRIQQAADNVSSQENEEVKIVIVGGGASGIELAMGMKARFGLLLSNDSLLQVTILDSGSELLPYESPACRKALRDVLQEKNIHVRHNCRVLSMEQDVIQLEDGSAIPYTHCIWATGAAPHASLVNQFQSAGLSVHEKGWIEVGPTLQSKSHENVFAAGDCVTIQGLVDPVTGKEKASPTKAGVYAVRTGPILIENISRFLSNQDLIDYTPQDDFLKLLMCGDGTALGFRFGLPLRGKWVWQLKNAIDCMFMDLFQVENLPKLDEVKEGEVEGKYDTSQYDEYIRKDERLSPQDAAHLIMRIDDDVDYQQAWEVLRDMMYDQEYKHDVLSCIDGTIHS